MKTGLKIFFVIILILAVLAGIGFFVLKGWYDGNLEPVNKGGESKVVQVEIKKGTGNSGIAELLEKEGIIKNATVFKAYMKLNKINNLQAGKYTFDTSKDDVKAIIAKLQAGEIVDDSIKVTFIEGKSILDYAKIIADKTDNSLEDVFDLLKNEDYMNSLIEKYWFLTDEIKNPDIYYCLEGYLRPDTYIFENKEVSSETIINGILDHTDKLLTENKEAIENSGYTVHQILTLASVVEKEASRNEDMPGIAGVFYNRLNTNMSLGSDVTTYYAFQVDMTQSDLSKEQINTYNPYNTRRTKYEWKISCWTNL